MNLPRLASDNHHFMLIIFLLLCVMGINAFFTMPRSEDPPLTLPGASIIIVYPGANPADLEELIVEPVEEAINELEDIKRIETTVKDGIVNTAVEFTFGTDAGDKFSEVVQQVNAIRNELPEDIYSLTINKWSSNDVTILQLAFVSDSAEYRLLEEKADRLKKEVERINGVRMVEIVGLPRQEIRVALNNTKMALMNISADQVAAAIQSNNLNIPGGSIRSGMISFTVKTSGSYKSLDEINNTVVGTWQGKMVFMRDVANVSFDYEDPSWIARFNGHRAVFLTVKQKENINIFSITENIQSIIEKAKQNTADGIRIFTVFDQSEGVNNRISIFLSSLLQGIILVGAIIFFSLGYRVALLVMLAVPLSTIIGLGFVDLAGFGLQQISIAALVIALGMLVDNSIVITENMERFIRKGIPPPRASIEATKQLFWAIVSSTVTTQLAFIPIIMMPDKSGKFIQSLPVTVILTLLASLLVAVILTPYLGGIFLRSSAPDKRPMPIRRIFNRIIDGPYSKMLAYSLKKPGRVLAIAVISFFLSLGLISLIGIGFFPKAEKNQFLIRITAPEQSDLHATDMAASKVEAILDSIPLVKRYATNVGHGNPRIYYNMFPKLSQKNFAEIYVELEYYKAREFDRLVDELREKFSKLTMARIEVKELEQGSPIEAPVVIKITGDHLMTLKTFARMVEEKLRKVPGVVNVDNQTAKVSTDLKIVINKEKAALLGVPVSEIDKTVRTLVAGIPISTYHDEKGKEYDIVLRMKQGDSIQVEELSDIYVKSLNNLFIPLSQLAVINLEPSPGILLHYNQMRCATITADIRKGYFLDDIINDLTPWLDAQKWPAGYDYFFTGELESRQESFGGMLRALIIAAFLIFGVLVLQFRSIVQPVIIFSSVPLAITGSTVTLFITRNPFSFTAFIGAISLIGIVVNNAIILVDYTNQLVNQGNSVKEALTEAGKTRFTPILLTAFTTIFGLLPLTLEGGTLWAPMGWTIIGGLLFSTLLTLIVVPVLYLLLYRIKRST